MMNCPIDGSELLVSDRQGIEIDHCPTCRGVWLDRGELDKIIERTARTPYADEPEGRGDERDDERPNDERGRGKRRRRSILEDLLDFG